MPYDQLLTKRSAAARVLCRLFALGLLWSQPLWARAQSPAAEAQSPAPEAPPAPAHAWPAGAEPAAMAPPQAPAGDAVATPTAPVHRRDLGPATMPQEEYEARMLTSTLLLTTGYGAALVTGALAIGSYLAAERVERWHPGKAWRGNLDVTGDGAIDGDDEGVFRTSARAFAILSGIGFCVGIAGSVLMAETLRDPRLNTQDRRAFVRPDRPRGYTLRYAPTLSRSGLGVSLAGRF